MKLQLGKTYIDKQGSVVKITYEYNESIYCRFEATKTGGYAFYNEQGEHMFSSDLNLVKELE
jgi:hypothetical protein